LLMADCQEPNDSAKDGAALDPGTGRWRPIAAAPVPIPAFSPRAVVAGHLVVRVGSALLDYEISADRWLRLPRAESGWYDVIADGSRVVLVSGSDEDGVRADLAYDVASRRWSRLPDDPIGPAFDRAMVRTPQGLVLLAHELVANPGGGDRPTFLLAALLDRATGQWRRLPDADAIGGSSVSVVGNRVILPSLDATNGGGAGKGDYGRLVPYGGRLDLATKTWSPLPHAPEYLGGGWPVDAPGSPVLAADGWFYDDATETWTSVPRPAGAPDRPGPAVWAGDHLIVVTGTFPGNDYDRIRDMRVWSFPKD